MMRIIRVIINSDGGKISEPKSLETVSCVFGVNPAKWFVVITRRELADLITGPSHIARIPRSSHIETPYVQFPPTKNQ